MDFKKLVHDIATEREALMVFGDNVVESKAVVSRKAKDAEKEIEKRVDSAIQEAEEIKLQIKQRLQKHIEMLENKHKGIAHHITDCDQISKYLNSFQNSTTNHSLMSIVDLVQKVVSLKASSKELRSNDVTNDISFEEDPTSLPPGNQQSICFQKGAVFYAKGVECGPALQPTAPNYHEAFPEKHLVDKSTQTNQPVPLKPWSAISPPERQPVPQKPWSAMSPQERQERQQQRRQDAARRVDEIHQRNEERWKHFEMRKQQIREKNKEILELGLCMCCVQKLLMK